MSDLQPFMTACIAMVKEFKSDVVIPDKPLASLHLGDDLEMDSLDLINFLFQIEEKFKVKVKGHDIGAKDLLVLGNLAAYVTAAQPRT